MRRFEILPHTAHTGFRAFGETIEDLFRHAAEALIEIALDPSAARADAPRQVEASGADIEELLVNWLNEVLYLLDGQRFVPAIFKTLRFENATQARRVTDGLCAGLAVSARLLGEPRDDARHPPRIVVKAATFHQLKIGEHNGRWEAEVYLDI